MPSRAVTRALGLALDSRQGEALLALVGTCGRHIRIEFISCSVGVFFGFGLCNELALGFANSAKSLAGLDGVSDFPLARRGRVGPEIVSLGSSIPRARRKYRRRGCPA
jgi:hypothetical protein